MKDKFQKIMHVARLRCANITKGQKMNAENCNILLYADSVIHIFFKSFLIPIFERSFQEHVFTSLFQFLLGMLRKKVFSINIKVKKQPYTK